ncbi:MAG: hypothetical protein GWP06_17455 [Actinobacteria bacterium]|nr:hypothetical protein [Actinomycetota bacterium]
MVDSKLVTAVWNKTSVRAFSSRMKHTNITVIPIKRSWNKVEIPYTTE